MKWPVSLVAIAACAWCLAQKPAQSTRPEAEKQHLLVLGQVTWAGLDWFPGGGVLAAKDAKFRDIAASAPINREGRFALFVEPGTYYLMAYVDVNANGRPDPPDGVGFYGVRQPSDGAACLEVLPESVAEIVEIEVTFQFAEDRKLHQAARGPDAVLGHVRGTVAGAEEKPVYVILWPAGDGWIGHACMPAADGTFELAVPAGDYLAFTVSDTDGDGAVQPGEPAGVLAENEQLRLVRVLPQGQVELAPMELNGRLNEIGQVEVNGQAIELPGARIPALCRLVAPDDLQTLPRQVLLFAEAAHKTLLASAWTPPGALLALRPATYYPVFGFDRDGDGRLGQGDLLAAPELPAGQRGLSVQEGMVVETRLGAPVALTPGLVGLKLQGEQK